MKAEYFTDTFNKISGEKRQKILDVAIAEFSERGFESANVNSIAQKAGISVGSIYKYFENKENLFLTVIHFAVETLRDVLKEIMQSEDDLESRIEKIIRAIQSRTRDNVQLTKLYNEMTTENRSSLVWKIASEMENTTAGLYASFIKQAQEAGEVKDDVDPNAFAFFLDNLFLLLQFSYACEYYKERMKIYIREDIFDNDDLVVEQLMKFIRGAFFSK
ncbi:MAG: TetR/AcrR family transcriptional regulator [Clostridiaceae bacterium]|nr:TetR/AcrR family transcriptional regulator [Clostridiaceae bacterium]